MKQIHILESALTRVNAVFEIPDLFKAPCATLLSLVKNNPGMIVITYVNSSKHLTGEVAAPLKLMGVHDDHLVYTQDLKTKQRGMCGVYPLVQWLKAKTVTATLKNKLITFRDLNKIIPKNGTYKASAIEQTSETITSGLSKNWEPSNISYHDYWQKMDDEGYKLLGTGYFSNVFQHKIFPNRVIKLSEVRQNANAIRWIQWCYKNPNKYVPKIYNIEKFIWQNAQKFVVIEMEKFNKQHPNNKQMVKWVEDKGLTNCIVDIGKYKAIKFNTNNIKQTSDPELSAVIFEILKLENSKIDQDITSDNVFIKNNDFIFADPITGGREL